MKLWPGVLSWERSYNKKWVDHLQSDCKSCSIATENEIDMIVYGWTLDLQNAFSVLLLGWIQMKEFSKRICH